MPGSIEKRGENSYRLIVSGGYDPDGKRKRYTKTIKIEKLKKGSLWTETGYIFTQWDGKPMYPYTFSEWFPKFLKKHGLRHITFH